MTCWCKWRISSIHVGFDLLSNSMHSNGWGLELGSEGCFGFAPIFLADVMKKVLIHLGKVW